MRTIVAVLVLAVAAGAGCDGGQADHELEEVAAKELNAAVQAAAERRLAAPGFEAVTAWFGESGAPVRSVWLDYRAGGNSAGLLSASNTLAGFVQVGDQRYEASLGPAGNQPWTSSEPLPDGFISLDADLHDMARIGAVLSGRDRLPVGYRAAWPGGGAE